MTNRAKVVILIVYTACFITVWKMNPHFSFENLQENEEDAENSTEFIKWAKMIKINKCCICATCTKEYSGLFMEQHFLSVNPFLAPEYNFTQEDFAWWKALQREAGSLANFTEAKDRFFALFPSKPDVSEPSSACCLTCAVVGNSRNLRGSKYGSQIDANDIIIRMNSAVIAGFEEDVGTKTTHRVLYPESAIDLDNNTHLVLFPFKILDLQWITEAFTTGFHGKSYAPIQSKIKGNKDLVMVVSPAFMKYVHTSWLSNKGHYPSTGFMTLVLAMHMCDEVKVFGFGADRDGDWSHYWEVQKIKNLKSGSHPGKEEYDLIQELAKQKKVIFFRGW